jgi:prepilin-type N-terminal cleavage/methylation domain-containing protein
MDMSKNCLKKTKYAFTLIELLVVVFIISVVFVGFYATFMVGTRYIIDSKNRLGASALVNEKMEIIRNLAFGSVGILGGVPDGGNIPEEEDVTANGRAFHVHTYVQYIDDPLDGVFPADVIPNDYKVVKVTVSWTDSRAQTQEISSMSRFVPPGLETTDGGAPLAINVKGSDSSPVKQAKVKIVNNAVVPVINFTVETDDFGHLMLPAAPASLGGYQFTISKDGYETVQTVDPASVSYVPTYRNQDVLLEVLNVYDYVEDRLSDLTIQTADYQNNPVAGIQFSITGGKIIGRDALNADVFNTKNVSGTTDSDGKKAYSNISPGNYTVSMDANAQYELIDHDPSISTFALVPGDTSTFKLLLADKNKDSLAVTVTDTTNSSIPDAKITLTDQAGTDIFKEKAVSDSGIMFYPDSSDLLPAGSYTLKVEASGYVTQTKSISVDKLTKETIKLVANS